MSCHLCDKEAIDRCFTCGRLFCAEHGTKNCTACQGAYQEGDPSGERISVIPTRSGKDNPWWRPQQADEFAPPACYECQSLTRAVCVACGRNYCKEHAGRNSTCRECSTASDMSLYVVGGFLLVFAAVTLVSAYLR